MSRVALYAAGGSPYNHAAILARAGHELSFVFPADIRAGGLDAFDAFVMPGGGYLAMSGQLDPLGAEGCRSIREYVEAGGMYIGSCAGSYDAATAPARFLELCPAQGELRLLDARIWNTGDSGVLQSPGIGELLADNVAPEHPVMAGMPARFEITHYNGPLFTGGEALAQVAGPGNRFTPAEDFLGASDGRCLIDDAARAGIANIVAGQRGAGRVVLFGSHPEFGSSLALDDTTLTARMLVNAVAWQLAETDGRERPRPDTGFGSVIEPAVVAADRADLDAQVAQLTACCVRLRARTSEPWLNDGAALSMFGVAPREIWTAAIDQIPLLAAEAAGAAPAIADAVLSFRPPADVAADPGVRGVYPLLAEVNRQLGAAETSWRDGAPEITDPYDFIFDSPYHLVAGSYLAAVGNAAAAALLVRAFRKDQAMGEATR